MTGLLTEKIPFSVAMSVYKNDSPAQLREALVSICEQSYPAAEIYLVVDGPISEELDRVILEFAEKYGNFTINRFVENKGRGIVLHHTLNNSKYDLVFVMDSDDISAPGRFEKQIKAYLEEPADVIGGWTLGFVGDLQTGRVSSAKRPLKHEDIVKKAKSKTPISHVTALYRRDAVLKAGNYQDLFYHEDYYLFVRMIQAGCTFRNIPEYLVYVRLGENQARRHGGLKYYKAGAFLRKYMLKHKIMSFGSYLKETAVRIVYQLLIPAGLRNHLAMKLKRKALTREEVDAILQENIAYTTNKQ